MFFNSDYNDLMPPVPENSEMLPEKKGFSRFLDIMEDHCVALLKANLLFLTGCIPVITIPVSLFAMNRMVRQMMQERPVKCGQVFMETFKRDWKKSYLAFLLTALLLGCSGYGMWFYMSCAVSSLLFLLPFVACSTIFLVTLLSSVSLYALLDSGKSLKESVRLALLLGVAKPLRTVPAALFSFGLPFLAILLLPLSGLYLLVIGFSLPCLIGHFFLRILLKQCIDGNDGEEPEEAG